MKSLKKKFRESKRKIGNGVESLLRPLMSKAGARLRLAPRIRLLNSRASKNPKRTFAIVFSTLLIIFLADLSLTLFNPVKPAGPNIDIASIDTVFNGFRTIQENKDIHRKTLSDMALSGNVIRHQLDSLIALPVKTRADSIQIRMNYLKLERIVKTLKNSE
ncbi:MAG: hypothetical protein K2G90_07980 [Muribaculaceae bacterium]|nr:hypothetical protein [Muribaculaceae bacterium]